MKKLIIVIGIIALAIHGKAQENEKANACFIGIYGTEGVHYFSDITSLNNAFRSNGFPEFSNHISVSHSGFLVGVSRFLVQFDERLYELREKGKGDFRQNVSGEGYEGKLGYDLLQNSNIDLYPYVGIGFQELSWIIDPKTPISLQQALNSMPLQSNKLSVKNVNMASVGILLNFRLISFSKDRIDFLIGGDFQYLYSSNGQWRLNEQLVDVGKVDLGGLSWMVNFTLKARLNGLIKNNELGCTGF
jgi:hypothetical protein